MDGRALMMERSITRAGMDASLVRCSRRGVAGLLMRLRSMDGSRRDGRLFATLAKSEFEITPRGREPTLHGCFTDFDGSVILTFPLTANAATATPIGAEHISLECSAMPF